MAKLIKSILANRMMFRGGGLVAPGHAGGILASSSPLIDSVTMNQGGLVNFMNGGVATAAPPEVLERSSQVPSPISGTWGFPTDVARFDPLSQNALSGQDIWTTPSEQMIERKNAQWEQRRNQVMAKLQAFIPEYLSKGADQQEAFRLALNDLSEEEKALIGQEAAPDETDLPPGQPIVDEPLLDVDMPKRPIGGFQSGTSWSEASKAEAHILNREGYVLSRMPESTQELLGLKFPDVWKQLHALEEAQSGLQPVDMSNAGAVLRERFEATPDTKKSDFYNEIKQEIKSLYEHSLAGWTQGPPGEEVDPFFEERRPILPPTEHGDRPGRDVGWAERNAEQIRKKETIRRLAEFIPQGPQAWEKDTDTNVIDIDDKGGLVEVTHEQLRQVVAGPGRSSDSKVALIEKLIANIAAGEKADIQDVKDEIEALMPAAKEEDDQTLGLLLAQFGATLMSTPGGFVEALGATGKEFIPHFIEYKNSIKEANRERQTAIASLAITEKLSREKERRTAISGIREYGAKALIEQEIDLTTPGNYINVSGQSVPANIFDEDAPEGQMMQVPPMLMTMTPQDAEELSAKGINFFKVKDADPDDLINLSIALQGGTAPIAGEDLDRYTKQHEVTILSGFLDQGSGYTFSAHQANDVGMSAGLLGDYVDERTWGAVTVQVTRANKQITQVQDLVHELMALDKSQITGVAGYKGHLQDISAAFFGGKSNEVITSMIDAWGIGNMPGEDINEWSNIVEGSDGQWEVTGETGGYDKSGFRKVGNVSVSKQYDIGARILLTQIAPMLLGESGKTISDADRVLVAQALGWTQASLKGGVFQLGKLNKEVFSNPAAIDLALERINQALVNQQEKLMYDFMSASERFNIITEPKLFQYGRGTVSAAKLFKKMMERPVQSGIVDYDFTQGA